MRTSILFATLALAAAAQSNRRTVAIAHDPSRSQSGFAGAMSSDEQRLIPALPDQTRVVVFTAGLRVRRVFEGDLNPYRRAELRRQMQAIRPVEPNTDLGAALDELLRALASSDGDKTAIVFTDAKNRPGPDSRNRGRSFETILNAVTLPASTRIVVRVYGNEPLNVSRPGVSVLRDSPDWNVVLNLVTKKPAPPPPPPLWYKWRFAVGLAAISVLVITAALWRKLAHTGKGADLLNPVEIPVEDPAPATARTLTRFRVEGGNGSVDLMPGEREFAIVGASPIADLPLQSAGGAWIQLRLNGSLTLHNTGGEPIYVGSRRIPPDASLKLPAQYVEARLGREMLRFYPETVVIEGEDS